MPSETELRNASREAQVERLREDLEATFAPPLLALATRIDRVLRRFPWLYRRLAG